MLEKSFGMITKARALSDEIAPATSQADNDSFLGSAARVIDSVGKAAPAFMPMLTSLIGGATAARSATATRSAPIEHNPVNPSPMPATEIKAGELSDLAGKIKNKDGKK